MGASARGGRDGPLPSADFHSSSFAFTSSSGVVQGAPVGACCLTEAADVSILKAMPSPVLPDLHTALGAGPPAGALQITVFIPSVDRNGQSIDQVGWREETLRVLGRLFRGATAFPPGRGVWRDDRTADLVFDDTVMVTCYVPSAALDQRAMATLRAFLHRLGREGNQGEVGVVIGSEYFGITEYDQEEVEHGKGR